MNTILPNYTDGKGRTVVKLEGYDKSKQARLTYKCAFEDVTNSDFEKLKEMEIKSGYLYDMSPNI